MLAIQESPIQCMSDRCIYPSKKLIGKTTPHQSYGQNQRELYGTSEGQFSRFDDLGIPMFVVKIENSYEESSAPINTQSESVISDDMFDMLFDRVSECPRNKNKQKQTKAKTKSSTKRATSKQNTTRKNKGSIKSSK